jgi:hypothetical protein
MGTLASGLSAASRTAVLLARQAAFDAEAEKRRLARLEGSATRRAAEASEEARKRSEREKQRQIEQTWAEHLQAPFACRHKRQRCRHAECADPMVAPTAVTVAEMEDSDAL